MSAEPEIPREVPHPCPRCGNQGLVPNGAYYRNLREEADLTQTELARECGISVSHLSRMELGEQAFAPKYAEVYERVCRRVLRSGQAW